MDSRFERHLMAVSDLGRIWEIVQGAAGALSMSYTMSTATYFDRFYSLAWKQLPWAAANGGGVHTIELWEMASKISIRSSWELFGIAVLLG